MGRSVSGSSSLLSSIGLELTQMKKCLQYEVQASNVQFRNGCSSSCSNEVRLIHLYMYIFLEHFKFV